MYFNFEPEKKKSETETFKYILFAAVVGISIYAYLNKANIKAPKAPTFSRARAASSGGNTDFNQFMSMYRG